MINQRVRWKSTMLYCNAVALSVELLNKRASGHRGFVREYLQIFGKHTASGAPEEISVCIASETSQWPAVAHTSKMTPN